MYTNTKGEREECFDHCYLHPTNFQIQLQCKGSSAKIGSRTYSPPPSHLPNPRANTKMSTLLGRRPVLPGSVSASSTRGGGGSGGKSVPVLSVPSPSAVAPPAAEDLLEATAVSAEDGAVSDVAEGAGGSGLVRWSSG